MQNICADLITVNDFFACWIKKLNIKRFGENIQTLSTNNPLEIYQYSYVTMKHMLKDLLKTYKKRCFKAKNVQYSTDLVRRSNNNVDAAVRTDENITERLQKFTNSIRTKKTHRILLRYLRDIGKVNHPNKINFKITCMLKTELNKLFESNNQLNPIAAPDVKIIFRNALFSQYKQFRLNNNYR